MMRLELGKSYLWLFAASLVLMLSALGLGMLFDKPTFAMLVLPIVFAFLLLSELKSEIALDGGWRALFKKGTFEYRLHTAWHGLALITSLVLSCFAIFFW